MTGAYLHLILNHIPLIALPVALVFLVFARRRHDDDLRRFALVVLALSALMVIPVYLSGESAEHLVEKLPGVLETDLHAHEEAAELSLVLSIVSAALGLATLALEKYWQKSALSTEKLHQRVQLLSSALIFVLLVNVAALGYSSNLGGKIRRPELRSDAGSLAPTQESDHQDND